MPKNKIGEGDQNMEFEESENVSCTPNEWNDSSAEEKIQQSNSREIELEKIDNMLISLPREDENLLINKSIAKGCKRKINCGSFLPVAGREKQQKTSSCASHHNDPVNSLETPPCVMKKTLELRQPIISDSPQHIESLNASKNPTVTGEKLSLKSIEVCNNAQESEEVFECTVPGCNRKFRSQKGYDIHMKHFHGVFNPQKSEPIMAASFYDAPKKVKDKSDCKSSHGFEGLKTITRENIKLISDNKPCSSTSLNQPIKLASKFSYSDILLPSSLTEMIEAVSREKTASKMVLGDKNVSDRENKNSGSSWKNSLLTKSSSRNLFSTEKRSSIQFLHDSGSQSNSNEKNIFSDDSEYILPHILSSTGDNPSIEVIQLNSNLEATEKSISDLKSTIQEEHLYSTSNSFDGTYKELANLDKTDYYGNLSSGKNENKDKIEDLFKNGGKLDASDRSVLLDHNVDSSKDVGSYEEFVKKKEMEYLDVGSSLQSKFSILKEISSKENLNKQNEISSMCSAVSLALNSSFASISNYTNISLDTVKTVGKNMDFIHRAFEICNCAKNMREIIFKCKEILDNIGNYAVPKSENLTRLPNPESKEHSTSEKQANKLLHYVFFLDVLRDPVFTSTYTSPILTKSEINVLNRLANPVSLYLTNTEMELPNVKLRRDREFLQRNSGFFSVLLKIQKFCHILPYNRSLISIEELHRPPTKLRLEKSDFFAQVFSDIETKKGHILMQSYGSEKDLRVSPFVECVCDNHYVHKLSGFVLLPKPDNSVTKDMCVGLCFESTTLSLGDCVSELFSIVEEIEKNIAAVRAELHKENAEYSSTEMKNNLLNIFDMIGIEVNSVSSSLTLISNFVNKLPENKDKYLADVEKELTKDSLKEIGRIVGYLENLKECDAIV